MEKDQEIELKLTFFDQTESNKVIDDGFLLSLTTGTWQTEKLVSTYYDTGQQILNKNRLTFRIRNSGHGYEATVKGGGKSEGGLHERQEWNVPLAIDKAVVEVFSTTAIGENLQQLVNGEELLPLFTTEFVRNKLLVSYGTGCSEIAVDNGEIRAGKFCAPINEIELELKSGDPIELIRLGAILSERFQLRLETRSKYYRGIALTGLPVGDSLLRSDQALYLLWSYLAKETQFIESPRSPTIRYEIMHHFDKLQLKIMKLAAGLNSRSYCLEILDDLRLFFQPLREAELIGTHYRRLIDKGEITPSYHRELSQLYRSHLHQITRDLVLALRQGKTTSYVLKLWAILLERNSE